MWFLSCVYFYPAVVTESTLLYSWPVMPRASPSPETCTGQKQEHGISKLHSSSRRDVTVKKKLDLGNKKIMKGATAHIGIGKGRAI